MSNTNREEDRFRSLTKSILLDRLHLQPLLRHQWLLLKTIRIKRVVDKLEMQLIQVSFSVNLRHQRHRMVIPKDLHRLQHQDQRHPLQVNQSFRPNLPSENPVTKLQEEAMFPKFHPIQVREFGRLKHCILKCFVVFSEGYNYCSFLLFLFHLRWTWRMKRTFSERYFPFFDRLIIIQTVAYFPLAYSSSLHWFLKGKLSCHRRFVFSHLRSLSCLVFNLYFQLLDITKTGCTFVRRRNEWESRRCSEEGWGSHQMQSKLLEMILCNQQHN